MKNIHEEIKILKERLKFKKHELPKNKIIKIYKNKIFLKKISIINNHVLWDGQVQ